MNPSLIFELANILAFLSWLLLFVFTFKPWASRLVFSFGILILALVYIFLIIPSMNTMDVEGFSTLAGVKALFSSDEAVAAGWLHYLTFDLMVGLYIIHNAQLHGIGRYLIFPALLLTFMMGPLGLVTYLLIRTLFLKKWAYYASRG